MKISGELQNVDTHLKNAVLEEFKSELPSLKICLTCS